MKIVLTGGPSAGKTTIAMSILREFHKDVALVPETASILFKGGFTRREHNFGIKHQQKAIYSTQVEHEAIVEYENPNKLIICDRGTLDGVAYWPQNESEHFLNAINSTLEDEVHRYDWVIHLDTAGVKHYNNDKSSIRTESLEEAELLNQKIKSAWEPHPKKVLIPTTSSFAHKIEIAHCLVEGIISNQYPKTIDPYLCE